MTPAPAAVRNAAIQVGGVFASREPALVRTVLGSCVAACLFDPASHIGGMNHFMLPEGDGQGFLSSRYGVHAMELLINKIMEIGGDRRRLHAKVFGGADLFAFAGARVGLRNSAFIRAFLQAEGIPLVAQRLGGQEGMAVHFFTATSKALVRPLGAAMVGGVAKQEERFRESLVHRVSRDRGEEITLF